MAAFLKHAAGCCCTRARLHGCVQSPHRALRRHAQSHMHAFPRLHDVAAGCMQVLMHASTQHMLIVGAVGALQRRVVAYWHQLPDLRLQAVHPLSQTSQPQSSGCSAARPLHASHRRDGDVAAHQKDPAPHFVLSRWLPHHPLQHVRQQLYLCCAVAGAASVSLARVPGGTAHGARMRSSPVFFLFPRPPFLYLTQQLTLGRSADATQQQPPVSARWGCAPGPYEHTEMSTVAPPLLRRELGTA